MSFRTGHRIVAAAVKSAREEEQENLTTDMLNQAAEKVIGQAMYREVEKISISAPQILRERKSTGGASPVEVQKMVKSRQACFNKDNLWVKDEMDRIESCKLKVDSARL